jgi:hypothetical protein
MGAATYAEVGAMAGSCLKVQDSPRLHIPLM